MAAAVAMRTMYEALGCSPQVADYLYDEEGLEDLEDLAELDPVDVRHLCKNVRNPGGGGAGHPVSNKATRQLIHASQYCKMQMRVGRPLLAANVRPGAALERAKVQLDLEQNHREDDSLFRPLQDKNLKDHTFSSFFSKWKETLGGVRNSRNISVQYVTRKNVIPPPIAEDPATNYNSHDEEVVARHRIVMVGQEGRDASEFETHKRECWTPQAILDNKIVYDKGELSFGKTRYWSHVNKTTQKNRDGRAMLAAIELGVLGPDALDARFRSNKRTMEHLTYH